MQDLYFCGVVVLGEDLLVCMYVCRSCRSWCVVGIQACGCLREHLPSSSFLLCVL